MERRAGWSIAPKWWVNNVASYASMAIAPRKVSLGMPAYGRDWFGGTVSGKCPASAKETFSRTTRGMKSFAQTSESTAVARAGDEQVLHLRPQL